MKSIALRYLIATVFFVAAELWVGIGLLSGLKCLGAFALASLVVGVVERRRLVAARSRARRSSGSRSRRSRDHEHSAPSSRPRPPRPRPLYDDETVGSEWPQLAEHRW
jgi:hypothetical protein